MKCKTVKSALGRIQWILLALFTLCFASCKDEEEKLLESYDPSKPVEITDFTPDSGGGDTYIVVYGKNFGTDTSLLKLTVGGKTAKVISVLGDYMYAIVPQKAFNGNFVLTVGEGENAQTVEAEKKFNYKRQLVVSNLCGETDDKGHYEIKNGPFDDCGGIDEPTWFSFDPENKHILYLAQDEGSKPIRVLDLKNQRIYSNTQFSIERPRTITWTLGRDGVRDTMIIASDRGGDRDVNNWYLVRDKNKPVHEAFNVTPQPLMEGKNCNGSAIHPINGELYYNSFALGDVFRFDYRNAWDSDRKVFDYTKREKLFSIQDVNWEFNMVIHPTGRYAYIVVVNQHYIMRTDYDNVRKRFGVPYLFCGSVGNAAWEDGTGDKARLNTPYQGVFVKNKRYVEANNEDEYDFYFTDRMNHCIRILTPEGSVTTFAGRGSSALNSNPYGYVNGALREKARFDRPSALAYDEETETFYVGDWMNHRIRKIALEEGDETSEESNN